MTASSRLNQLARIAGEMLMAAARAEVNKQLGVAAPGNDQQRTEQAAIVNLSGPLFPWHEDAGEIRQRKLRRRSLGTSGLVVLGGPSRSIEADVHDPAKGFWLAA
jgi:hypothetical protein